jgi:hypothetical protein
MRRTRTATSTIKNGACDYSCFGRTVYENALLGMIDHENYRAPRCVALDFIGVDGLGG